jgi:phosphoenolpyruvate carboxylase
MLSRYIHTQFDLAVLDVYVYPLAANSNTSSQLINELTDEQKDIKLLSAAFGKEALQMSSVNLAEQMSDELATDVYYFEATLDTSSDEVIAEPLFVTQYAFVKEDKIVRFSTNIPLRITKPLVAQMATQVQVPAMSAFMQDIRGPLLVQHSEL